MNKAIIGIYKIISRVDGKYYVGSSKNISKRWRKHVECLKSNRHYNIHLQRAFNLYGIDNFNFLIICECLPQDLAVVEEAFLSMIDKETSYNISKKAEGGDLISYHPNLQEIKQKHSENTKRRWASLTEEEKLQYSENFLKGEKNPNYGNKWTEEAKEKMSQMKKGIPNLTLKGKSFEEVFGEEEAKRKKAILSQSAQQRIGNKNPFYGKSHSEETKKKLSVQKLGKQTNPSNIRKVSIEGKIYRCIVDAAKILGVCDATIIHRIKSPNPKFANYFYVA